MCKSIDEKDVDGPVAKAANAFAPTVRDPSSLYADLPSGGAGPHCLFIHGFLSSRAQWLPNLDALKAVCRPVVVELWGHGRSPAPHDPAAYSIEGYVAQFEALRQRLGVPAWYLYGPSFGGGLALHYAIRHPQRVLGVIFTNTNAALSSPEEIARRGATSAAGNLEVGGEAARQALQDLPMHPRYARRLLPAVKAELLADAERLVPQAIALSIRHTAPCLSVLDQVGQLHMPLLLLNGRFEAAFQPLCEAVRQQLPTMEVVDLDGGHAVNVECAEASNQAVMDFIRRHGAE